MLLEAQILSSDIDWFGLVCTLDKLGCTKLGYRGLNDIASYEMTKPPHVDMKQPSPLLHFFGVATFILFGVILADGQNTYDGPEVPYVLFDARNLALNILLAPPPLPLLI